MGSSVFLVVTVFVLDLIAFGLGIGAELRRAKGKYMTDADGNQWCAYNPDIASGLAVGAVLFLLISQVLIVAATRCLCCGNSLKPGAARAFAIIFFLLTWITFLIAEACFLAGSVQNAKHTRYLSSIVNTDKLTCQRIRKDTFAAGVAFTFFTFFLSVGYYLCYGKAREDSWKKTFNRGEAGVNMTPYG